MVTGNDILYKALQDDDFLKKHIDELNAIVKEYPYFQSAWAASVRYLKLRNTYFTPALQQTAARSIDRSHLFEFVNKQQNTVVKKPENPKESVEKPIENTVVRQSKLPVSNKVTAKPEETKQKAVIEKKQEPVNKEVLIKKTEQVKKEEPVKKTVLFKKDKPEKEETLVKKKEPVKIIRPIPRTITNAIPKKLVKTPDKKAEKPKEKPVVEMSKKEIKPKEEVQKNIAKTPEKVIEKEVISKPEVVAKPKVDTKQVVEQKPETIKASEKTVEPEITKKKEVVDKQLQMKEPVEQVEKLSYTEWLQRFNKQRKKKKTSNIDLIEKFLKERPKIVPKKNVSVKPPEIIEQSVVEKQMLMTETLANLYLKQKKYEKAIQAFRILSLKYPKKSSYFANQIKEIEQKLK